MKKIITLLAVACALPVLFSCNKDKKDDKTGSATIPTGDSFNNSCTISGDDVFATFNADNSCLLGRGMDSKSVDYYEYFFGTYSFASNKYTIRDSKNNVYATIEILSNGTISLQTAEMALPVEMTVTITRPSTGNENQRASNHTWKPESLILTYRGANKTWTGIDFNEAETWIASKFEVSGTYFGPDMKLTSLFISDKYVNFVFKNGQNVIAPVEIGNGLTFSLNQIPTMDDEVDLLNGTCSVVFDNGKCIVTIEGSYDSVAANAVMTFGL